MRLVCLTKPLKAVQQYDSSLMTETNKDDNKVYRINYVKPKLYKNAAWSNLDGF